VPLLDIRLTHRVNSDRLLGARVNGKLRCRASQQPTIWPHSLIAPATLFAVPQDSARRPLCECVRQRPILTALAHGDRPRDEDQRFAAELMTVEVAIRFEVASVPIFLAGLVFEPYSVGKN
jgi:hypothetical protein